MEGGRATRALQAALQNPTSQQVGDLGEETAVVYLETVLNATIIAIGDSGMARTERRQDLDLVAALGDQLVVFEVKSTYTGRRAGHLTRTGNLYRPRLSSARARADGSIAPRQGSQDYAARRLASLIEVDDDFPGVEARAVVVDLRSLLIQQFGIDDAGRVNGPIDQPADCTDACEVALDRILEHRGRL